MLITSNDKDASPEEPAQRVASPENAWQIGVRAAEAGDFFNALRWLERAARLAPNDVRIAMDLAHFKLQAGGMTRVRDSLTIFEELSARHDVASVWLGLATTRWLVGNHKGAAEALLNLLSRHCVPRNSDFSEMALAVAAKAGWPGWCGVGADGALHIALVAGTVEASVDGVPAVLAHLDTIPDQQMIALHSSGAALLGSPLSLTSFRRCEGIVETFGSGLAGWVSRPAAPETPPELFLVDGKDRRQKVVVGAKLPADLDAPLSARYRFECPPIMLLGLEPPFCLVGADGTALFGSPIDPGIEAQELPVSATLRGLANSTMPARAQLIVVVPVYGARGTAQACLLAALKALPPLASLIVIDDASPDPNLTVWLDEFCSHGRVTLIRHENNLGFAAAANSGFRAAANCDVLLLNSDTLLPPRAVKTLLDAVYSRPDIGSATPFSNEASICSYPRREGSNATPDLVHAIEINALAVSVNENEVVEIPTGVGFCLLMRHDCIKNVGYFRSELFAQGYGEEVDWCLRAARGGYRHIAVPGAFVSHFGKKSFRNLGKALNERNGRILRRLYPGYDQLVEAHAIADPLFFARRKLDLARFRSGTRRRAVLMISHAHGGGVARRVDFEMQQIRKSGLRPILLYPMVSESESYPFAAMVTDTLPGEYPNLRFTLPQDEEALLDLLRHEKIAHVVLHHCLGHHSGVRKIAENLGCPMDVVIHDYASFCPRVHLIGMKSRYCGEPAVTACKTCIAQAGDATGEDLGLNNLLDRSRGEFSIARKITAPSIDSSRRISRHFPGVEPVVVPWEDDTLPVILSSPGIGPRRIAIIGGIGPAKGFYVLLDCARDAASRNLPLEFILVGNSFDDEELLKTGRVFITGFYEPADLVQLLTSAQANLAFIPSIWPETWCYALSEAWSAGLYTLAFDLGAQAERIAATRRGGLLPLGLPPARVNDVLLNWQALSNKEAVESNMAKD